MRMIDKKDVGLEIGRTFNYLFLVRYNVGIVSTIQNVVKDNTLRQHIFGIIAYKIELF